MLIIFPKRNFATDRDNRGTIIAGSNGQRYYYNVLVNPDNDYEMIALNWTKYELISYEYFCTVL